jgi:hypothetical protein
MFLYHRIENNYLRVFILKRLGVILLVLFLQFSFTTATAQEFIDGTQKSFTCTLSDPIEYTAFCFVDSLEAGTHVYWTFDVLSEHTTVDFFIMDSGNWTLWDTAEEIVYPIHGIYETTHEYGNIEIPYTSTWYFVFRNPIGQERSVEFEGTLSRTDTSTSPTTTATFNPEDWYGLILIPASIIVIVIVVGYIVYKKS